MTSGCTNAEGRSCIRSSHGRPLYCWEQGLLLKLLYPASSSQLLPAREMTFTHSEGDSGLSMCQQHPTLSFPGG